MSLWLLGGPATALAEAEAEPGSVRCPILYYHETFGQRGFEAHLAAFLLNGYLPIPLGRLVSLLEAGEPAPPGCMVLTFDDGLASQMSGALPVLARYHVAATFFVMPAFQDGVHRYMTAPDFRIIRDQGLEVGSHTLNHASLPALRRLSPGAYLAEAVESRRQLEAILDQPVTLFAYPNGSWDAATAADIPSFGYRAAVSTMPGSWHARSDLFWLQRLPADPSEAPSVVLKRMATGRR